MAVAIDKTVVDFPSSKEAFISRPSMLEDVSEGSKAVDIHGVGIEHLADEMLIEDFRSIVLNDEGDPSGGVAERPKVGELTRPSDTSLVSASAASAKPTIEGTVSFDVEMSMDDYMRTDPETDAWALAQLEVRPDKLRESGPSSGDQRPIYSCIRPIVCHKTNTPFYAQCSTAKLGYCTWCRALRRGNQKQGSICMNCGERLTAKYHKWYPELVRLEPLEKVRTKSTYRRYKAVFERFGVTWRNDHQLEFVVDNYMLMKIYVSHPHLNIDALHLERAYMVGVFAGREFNTGALARKLLREGCKLIMFRADFPQYFEFLRPERAAVAENLNMIYFKGENRCYLHSHIQNIEGWFDPTFVTREELSRAFKALCADILKQTTKMRTAVTAPTRVMSVGGGGDGRGGHHADHLPRSPRPPPRHMIDARHRTGGGLHRGRDASYRVPPHAYVHAPTAAMMTADGRYVIHGAPPPPMHMHSHPHMMASAPVMHMGHVSQPRMPEGVEFALAHAQRLAAAGSTGAGGGVGAGVPSAFHATPVSLGGTSASATYGATAAASSAAMMPSIWATPSAAMLAGGADGSLATLTGPLRAAPASAGMTAGGMTTGSGMGSGFSSGISSPILYGFGGATSPFASVAMAPMYYPSAGMAGGVSAAQMGDMHGMSGMVDSSGVSMGVDPSTGAPISASASGGAAAAMSGMRDAGAGMSHPHYDGMGFDPMMFASFSGATTPLGTVSFSGGAPFSGAYTVGGGGIAGMTYGRAGIPIMSSGPYESLLSGPPTAATSPAASVSLAAVAAQAKQFPMFAPSSAISSPQLTPRTMARMRFPAPSMPEMTIETSTSRSKSEVYTAPIAADTRAMEMGKSA